jgi:D-glycero-alpha-D-manno-heptose 1-phosphate guanylyltransferase
MTAAIVLAGGLGTRLRGAVPHLPKPMAPVGGRPFLEHQFDYWIGQGIDRFVVSVGYRREAITEHFGHAYRGVPIDYAIEEQPLGTGGGLLLAAGAMSGAAPFLVLNGDTFFEVDLARLQLQHAQARSDWTFALFRTGESGRYMGMDVAADGRIAGLRSGSAASGQLANGGVYLVERGALQAAARPAEGRISLEDDVLPALLAAGLRLCGFESGGRFIDIGVPQDYERAGRMLAAAPAAAVPGGTPRTKGAT